MSRVHDSVNLGLVIPLHGPAGISGPSCEACAQLAVDELNQTGGLLGREIQLVTVDGSETPEQVAQTVEALALADQIDAVVGWHLSSVRRAIVSRIAGRLPYVYSPLYEGGEESPGVFLAGETPGAQVRPALSWLMREQGVRRWYIVGNDYVWPRDTARAAEVYIRDLGGQLAETMFVPLDTSNYRSVLRRIESTEADGVLMLLVGQDAVLFNRQFAQAGLDERCVRFSPLMEENMLLASGASSTRGLYAAAGYFDCMPTADNLDFHRLYVDTFGPAAPSLGSLGESCYEAVHLLAALTRAAGSLDCTRMCRIADTVGYDGPRGSVYLHRRHLRQRVHLAEARELEFEVVGTL